MAKRSQFLRTDNTRKRIVEVLWVRDPEEYPDLSHLGNYSSEPDEVHIDRKERGHMGRGEHRYFNLGTGDKDYIEEDYRRAERYNAGDWCMLFCQAVAHISINGVLQTVTSGGIGGVESDSDASYFEELKKEQLAELWLILRDMGFSKRATTAAIDKCEDRD